jgi:hypothetical protein
MLARLRTHFGTAGLVVAIVALIAALGGGAYAATNSGDGGKANSAGSGDATASAAGKQGPRGKTGKTGKTGPAGPAGPAGPQGAAGAAGKDGANGTNGAAGATGPTGNKGTNGNAGAVGETGPTGATGPTGSFGGAGLAAGTTETGYWAFRAPGVSTATIKDGDDNMVEVKVGDKEVLVPISFPEKLPGTVEMNDFKVRFSLTDPEFSTTCGTGPGGAGGKSSEPKAPAHTLCIWVLLGELGLENATFSGTNERADFGGGLPLGKVGAVMKFTLGAEGPGYGSGSWALTN